MYDNFFNLQSFFMVFFLKKAAFSFICSFLNVISANYANFFPEKFVSLL